MKISAQNAAALLGVSRMQISRLFERGHHAPMIVSMVDMVDDRDDRSASEALRTRA